MSNRVGARGGASSSIHVAIVAAVAALGLAAGCEKKAEEEKSPFEFPEPDPSPAAADGEVGTDDAPEPADAPEPEPEETPSPEDVPPPDAQDEAEAGCTTDEECAEGAGDPGLCRAHRCEKGTCVVGNEADGTTCDDGDLCTAAEACKDGECEGLAKECDDEDPCTEDGCDPATGDCSFDGTPRDGETCDDGDACTDADVCQGGACAGAAKDCSDGDDCTKDTCDPETAECGSAPIDGCGLQSPCDEAESPTSNDFVVTSCVCGDLPACCEEAWGPECVAAAETLCGALCGCDPESPGTFACEEDAGCKACGEVGDACSGGWACSAEGFCEVAEPVVCTVPEGSCGTSTCDPATGACVFDGDDGLCGDDDVCTKDTCDPATALCANDPIPTCKTQDPCLAVATPESGDPEITDCVCELAPKCCTTAWDASCVNTAVSLCDLVCVCADLPAELLTCSKDSDCKKCDDADPCTVPWKCDGGTCKGGGAVECPLQLGSPCLGGVCDPETGGCVPAPLHENCDDGKPCTIDTCLGNGKCENAAEAGCGEQPPCDPSPFPTSSDATATACVCEVDPFCCEVGWDGLCVLEAGLECGKGCTCDDVKGAPIRCESDGQCQDLCDDGDACNGVWTCEDGVCQESAPVVCPGTSDADCLVDVCDPESGLCVETGPDEGVCADGNPCTVDSCDTLAGSCKHGTLPSCSPNHPCEVSPEPYASILSVVSCVCGEKPECCSEAWSANCVAEAQTACGVECDCGSGTGGEGPTCVSSEDCSFCDDEDLCNGVWFCEQGACQKLAPPVCPNPGGCAAGSCDPATGDCVVATDDSKCDDKKVCTMDLCSAETGKCEFPPVPGCGQNHPCQEAETPTSSSFGKNNCVCAKDKTCCDVAWDAECVQIADKQCDTECDCKVAAALGAPVACKVDFDCAFCDDGDKCNGDWKCGPQKTCEPTPSIFCDPALDAGCFAGQCDPATGVCSAVPQHAECADDDACTEDTCGEDAGCHHDPIYGCSDNDPCDAAGTPGASDVEVAQCVCVSDPACCDVAWDSQCVSAVLGCGLVCDCASTPKELLPCETAADCAFCDDDSDLCNGAWGCSEDGFCVEVAPVACDPKGDFGCILSTCEPATGLCALKPSDAACDDGKSCTTDTCTGNATCENAQVPDCDDPDPCVVSQQPPGDEDPETEDCVCGALPGCCTSGWSQNCVDLAVTNCGLVCDCDDVASTVLPCGTTEDCAFCQENPCGGSWSCVEGYCEKGPPVVCDDSSDFGCLVNTCNPVDSSCQFVLRDDLCDDGKPCTKDFCDSGTAECANEVIPGCP